MSVWDPTLSSDATLAAFRDAAQRHYGAERAQAIDAALQSLAHDVWLVAQERLDHLAEMPDTMINPECL